MATVSIPPYKENSNGNIQFLPTCSQKTLAFLVGAILFGGVGALAAWKYDFLSSKITASPLTQTLTSKISRLSLQQWFSSKASWILHTIPTQWTAMQQWIASSALWTSTRSHLPFLRSKWVVLPGSLALGGGMVFYLFTRLFRKAHYSDTKTRRIKATILLDGLQSVKKELAEIQTDPWTKIGGIGGTITAQINALDGIIAAIQPLTNP